MDVDTSLSNINDVVAKARDELSSVISALTELLAAVAVSNESQSQQQFHLTLAKTSGSTTEKVQTNGPSADAKPPEPQPKRSLEPVLIRFQSLRKAVEQAVSLHTGLVANAKKEEADVTSEERAALTERRTALVTEVRAKNEKVKLLIDHLRDLHRDIVMLLSSYYKPLSTQPR